MSQDNNDFKCGGVTTSGMKYTSIAQMWKAELAPIPSNQSSQLGDNQNVVDSLENQNCSLPNKWYGKSSQYWENQDPTINGMLGGLGELHALDVAASKRFLENLWRRNPNFSRSTALDVGSGIGRVTKSLLLPLFEKVDMLEQNSEYLHHSTSFLADYSGSGIIDKRLCVGMQDFSANGVNDSNGNPSGLLINKYDIIWIQWCIIYLTDDDLVSFLTECKRCLRPGGFICLKDNVMRHGFLVDNEDSSIVRSDNYLKHLFGRAGMEVVRETVHLDFPKDIFPVRTYAIQSSLQRIISISKGEDEKQSANHIAGL